MDAWDIDFFAYIKWSTVAWREHRMLFNFSILCSNYNSSLMTVVLNDSTS